MLEMRFGTKLTKTHYNATMIKKTVTTNSTQLRKLLAKARRLEKQSDSLLKQAFNVRLAIGRLI
jgi:TRAP-type mannitol/chloroaromatic compound transport system substrate-binding protein